MSIKSSRPVYFNIYESFLQSRAIDNTAAINRRALSSNVPRPGLSKITAEKSKSLAKFIDYAQFAVISSRSKNPFFNLSIEHYLLQKSRPDSVIFFNYVNRPCVVIGRNQNPWLEVNLGLINKPTPLFNWSTESGSEKTEQISHIDLVRRRSGGGTVFHDEGNFNYSIICPKDDFNRNKYVEMVVRALRSINSRARVNERHDIVLDQGTVPRYFTGDETYDTHRTPWEDPDKTPLKVSGSAFKMTRLRALHHGTCLLHSPNLPIIHSILKSPAANYIEALGVDSVRSPVSNVAEDLRGTAIDQFRKIVIEEFLAMHQICPNLPLMKFTEPTETLDKICLASFPESDKNLLHGWVDEDHAQIDEIGRGMEELTSLDWIYGQTPRFTFSNRSVPNNVPESAALKLTNNLVPEVFLSLKHGLIEELNISLSDKNNFKLKYNLSKETQNILHKKKLYDLKQVALTFSGTGPASKDASQIRIAQDELADWLKKTLLSPG